MNFLKYYLLFIIVTVRPAFAELKKIDFKTKELCELALEKPQKKDRIYELVTKKIKDQKPLCTNCFNLVSEQSKRQINFIASTLNTFKDVDDCEKKTKKDLSTHADRGAVFTDGLDLILKMRSHRVHQITIPFQVNSFIGTCTKSVFAHSSTSSSEQQSCNSFLESQLGGQEGSEGLIQLMSTFVTDDNELLERIDSPEFCEHCLKDKFALQSLLRTNKDLSENDVEKKFQDILQQNKERLASHLAEKRSLQQALKLTHLMQQNEHFKYSYGIDNNDKFTCLNFKKMQDSLNEKCSSNKQNAQQRIDNIFKKINGKSQGSLSQNLDAMLLRVKEADNKCENGNKVSREHFLAFSRESLGSLGKINLVQSTLNALFNSENLFENNIFKSILEENPTQPLSVNISKYLLENLKMDNQNANQEVKNLFGEDTAFSEQATQVLKSIGLEIPFDGELTGDIESKFVDLFSGVFEQVSVVDPMLKLALGHQDSFENLAKEYQRIPSGERSDFSDFIVFGHHGKRDPKFKEEIKDRFFQVYKKECDKIHDNFIEAICDATNNLDQYSNLELKEGLNELRAQIPNRTNLDSIGQASLMCEQNSKEKDPNSFLLENIEQDIPFGQSSDIMLDLFAEKSKKDVSNSFFGAFSLSKDRACNAELSAFDISSFHCHFRGECKQQLTLISSEAFSEVSKVSSQAKVDSTKLQTTRAVRKAKKAIERGESFETAVAENLEKTQPVNATSAVSSSNVSNKEQLFKEEVTETKVSEKEQVVERSDQTKKSDDVEPVTPTTFVPTANDTQSYLPPASVSIVPQDVVSAVARKAFQQQQESDEKKQLLEQLSEFFTPDQLEKLSVEQLRKLAQTKKEADSLPLNDLEKKKKELQKEIAQLQRKKEESSIQELEEQKKALEDSVGKTSSKRKKVSAAISSPSSAVDATTQSVAATASRDVSTQTVPKTASAEISTQVKSDSAFARPSIKSTIPVDISSADQASLGLSINNYLKSIESQNLLMDENYIKFETKDKKVIAVFVQNDKGQLVRIVLDKLDENTKKEISKYQKISEQQFIDQERSVLSRISKLEQAIKEQQSIQQKRESTLDSLNAQLEIFDRQIRSKK